MNVPFRRIGLSCLVAAAPLSAQEFRSYVGGNNSIWESPTNWNPNLVPDSISEGARLDNGVNVNVGGSHVISALEFKGASLTLNQSNVLRTSVLLIESAGTIAGPGTLVMTQVGTISDNSGVTFSNVTFRNEGELDLFFGIGLAGDSVFQNVNTMNFVDGSNIGLASGAGVPGRIENTGFLRKVAGAGTATIGRPIDNDNDIVSLSGTFALTGGIDSSGNFRTEGDGEISLSGANVMTNGAMIFGDGLTNLAAGSLSVPVGATVSVDNFQAGSGLVINDGTMNYQGVDTFWDSAFISGSGTTRVSSGAFLTIEESSVSSTLTDGQTVEIESGGTLFFEGDRSDLRSNSPILMINQGLIEFAEDGDLLQNGASASTLMTLINEPSGRVIKSGGAANETEIIAEVIHRGDWTVETGAMEFFRKVDFSAPMEARPGTTVSFRGGTSTPSIFRAGSRLFGGGEFVLRTPVEIPGGAVVDADRLRMRSSSKLFGTGVFRVTESGICESGSLENQVRLEILPAATFGFEGTGNITIASGSTPTILNQGQFEIGNTNSIFSNGTGRFENEGTLVLSEAGRLFTNSGTDLVIENTGTIIKEAGTGVGNGARSLFPAKLTHRGVMEVRSGILDLFGEQEFHAPISVDNGAVLRLDGIEATTFYDGGVITGEGSIEHRGAEIVIQAGVRAPFANYSTPSGSGKVSGGGTFVLTDDSSFTRLNHGGAGVTEIGPTAAVVMNPSSFRLFDGRKLHVRGSLEFLNSVNFTATNGMTLDNDGLLLIRDGTSWNHGGGDYLLENDGTIRIEAPGTQTVSFAPDEITGNGLFDVVTGRLRFLRAVDISGTVRLGSGTQVSGVNLSFGPGSTAAGTGQISGPVTLKGAVAPGFSIGTLNVSNSATFTSSGSLVVELADGSSDLLSVSAALDLGGLTIVPQLVSGYVPTPGDSWTIATAGSFVGSVGLVGQASAAPGFGYFLSQNGNDLVLTYSVVDSFQKAIEAATGLSLGNDPDLTAFATGDLDGDGVQDLTDWAFGGTLGGADSGRNLRVDSVVQINPTTREVTVAFPIRSIVSDVTMSLEGDLDLVGSFSPLAFAPAGTETRGGILFQVGKIQVPMSAGSNFFRVRVELN